MTASVRLGDLVSIQSGYSVRGKTTSDPHAEYALLQPADLDEWGQFDYDRLERVADLRPRERHTLQEGDVVFVTRGTHKAAYVDEDLPDVVASMHLFLLRPALNPQPTVFTSETDVRPAYLAWYLRQAPAQAYFESLARGTYVPRVSKDILADLRLPLPPPDEQERIARLGTLAETEHRLAQEHARRRHALVSALLVEKLQRTTPDY